MLFDTACIVGVGLIGGSFGMAVRQRGLVRHVVGAVRREATINEAFQLGAVDNATTDLAEAARGADILLLAPPVGEMPDLCRRLAPIVKAGAIITDAGSTKAEVVHHCSRAFGTKAHFLGGHPMAGSEQTGVRNARHDLFERAVWILTPTPTTPPDVTERMVKLVEGLGAQPLLLDPETHDRLLAVTSHLPHITATALVHLFMDARDTNEVAQQLIGTGWRDGTRVAAGSSDMWRDICLSNAEALTKTVDQLCNELDKLRTLLSDRDGDGLHHWFEAAASVRRKHGYIPRGQ